MNKSAARPGKRALLIGINEYPNLPAYSQLRGCVNDVEAMRLMLERSFHFPPENVVALRNAEATEQGIRAAMTQLYEACGDGDIVVFHYSGHGSRMAAKGVKPTGYDESIMPYDSGRRNPDFPVHVEPRDIRDTDIEEWLARLTQKTPHVTLIFDSCHSGSITRLGDDSEAEGTRLRWVRPDPLPSGAAPTDATARPRGEAREAGGSGWLSLSEKYVLLAACAAEQGAYELDDVGDGGTTLRHGAFTFYLTREIDKAPDKSTYLDIWERVALSVTQRFKKQTPLLEGTRHRALFDVQDFAPMRYLLVTGCEGDEARLAGGAVHGVTVGSLWDVYPAGTKRAADAEGGGPQGRLEITEVKSVTSKAKVVKQEPPGAIAANARAVESLRNDSRTRMPVWLAPAPRGYEMEAEEMRQSLQQSELLTLTDSAKGSRAEVTIAADDGGFARWEVFDRSRALLMNPCEVGAPGSKPTVRENLETVWAFEKVLELRNDKSALTGMVDFFLLKKDSDGAWRRVPRDEKPAYKAGDHIAFGVVNRTGAPIHVSVLDLGLSKRIEVLYPPFSASEEVTPARSGGSSGGAQASGELVVGVHPIDRIELSFPDNLTFLDVASAGGPARGTEYFKLVVTTRRHDLNFLRQSGLRGKKTIEPEHPLERLLYLAARSGRTREACMSLEPQDEWLTEERAFWLERNV